MPDFSVEDKKRQLDFNNIAGVDEAGRGPWAGPVYSAIVILNRNCIPEGINDSKKISEKKRIKLYEEILINHKYGIGCASPDEIDQLNILEATFLSMRRALENLIINQLLMLNFDFLSIYASRKKFISAYTALDIGLLYYVTISITRV